MYSNPPVSLGEFLTRHPDQMAIINNSVSNENPNAFVEPLEDVTPVVTAPKRLGEKSRVKKIVPRHVSESSTSTDEEEAFRDSEASITYSDSTEDEADYDEDALPQIYPLTVKITAGSQSILLPNVVQSVRTVQATQVNPTVRLAQPITTQPITTQAGNRLVQLARTQQAQVNPTPIRLVQPTATQVTAINPAVRLVRPTTTQSTQINPQRIITYIPPRT